MRKYSWLNQSLSNKLSAKKNGTEYIFKIINENFNPAKQTLHLNFFHQILSFIKKEKEKVLILFYFKFIMNGLGCCNKRN